MTVTLDHNDIKTHIIHRYENLLIDKITMEKLDDAKGELETCISEDDPLNRQLFLGQNRSSDTVILTPIFMEILALASITCSGKVGTDQIVFFTGINNFERFNDLLINQPCKGSINKLSEKKGFLKYKGELRTSDNQTAATGVMTAYFMQQTDTNNDDSTKKRLERPDCDFDYEINKSNYSKSHWMMLVDQFAMLSDSSGIGRYTYPSNHPLTKGHFPNNPVMMGVMQWMSVADTCCVFAQRQHLSGSVHTSCNAVIVNQNNIVIAEFKGVECTHFIDNDNHQHFSDVIKTNRIVFRSTVIPEDTIYIWATDIIVS